MSLKKKREWEKNVGTVASSSQLENQDRCDGGGFELPPPPPPPPVVPSKRVCPHCQREFKNSFALGGHIRIHNRKMKFTHKKCNKRRRQDLLHGFLTPLKKKQCRRDHQQQPQEVIDLSNSSFELGYYGDVEDDYDNNDIMERLRTYGINVIAHKIERNRKMYVCIPCQVFMLTFHDVLVHTNARQFFVEVDQVNAMGGENADLSVEASSDVNLSVGVEEDEMGEKASTKNGDEDMAPKED